MHAVRFLPSRCRSPNSAPSQAFPPFLGLSHFLLFSHIKSLVIPDHLLEIEITESIAFDNVTFLEKTVSELKSKGFLISIDDFGTGFSSLSLLKNIPIDVLKIDQSFFRESIHKEKDNIVIKGIIDLVNKLSIRTVAEGIETAEQVAFLKSVNCNMIQGYFFYRPLPEDKFEEILKKEYTTKAPAFTFTLSET